MVKVGHGFVVTIESFALINNVNLHKIIKRFYRAS